ncbi:CGNR zinc finger domain-containing protein, partial [Amycolatopsis lexingtonensis]
PRRNRQWCSMSRCGNRAKARAHYARVSGRED